MKQRYITLQPKKKAKFTPIQIVVSIVFSLYCLILIYPYIYGLFASIHSIGTFRLNAFIPFPGSFSDIDFSNYIEANEALAYGDSTLLSMLGNSLWYSLGMSIIGLFFATITAYVCAKYRFPGRKLIYVMALVMMMVPIIGGQASQLKFTTMLHGYDSPLYVLINAQTIGGSFIIIYAVFKGVDWSYAESAFIDGAGHFRTFFKVMLPQIISPLSALFITDFIACWSDADTSLIYFPNLPTLGTGLYYAANTFAGTVKFPVYMAAMMLVLLPSVILFLIFHNKLMDIQMGGALKG